MEDYGDIKKARKCCVSGCSDTTSKRHRFPIKEPEVFQAWIERIKPPLHDNLSIKEIYCKYVVCEQHFSKECLVAGTRRGLKRTAVPSINMPEFDAESSLVMDDEQIPGPSNVFVVSSCLSPEPSITVTDTSHPEATKSRKVVIGHGTNRRPLRDEENESLTINLSPRATDTRYFSKDFMTEFIRVYRQHPSLWKIKSKEYTNRNLKNVAITNLINVCKQFHVMEANKEFVLKKIQSIRGSFRKENKKLKDSQRCGASVDDFYVPTLWYFDLLKFTLDQEITIDSFSNFERESSEISESSEESQDSEPQDNMEGNNSQNEEEEVKLFQLPTKARKRAKKYRTTKNESTAMFMKACTEALSTKNTINEEFQAVGRNVSAKLQKIKPTQQAYAEYLIHKILTWGALEKLTENTDVVNSHLTYNPNQQSSISSSIHYND